jgi:hypothetical protein
MDDNDKLAYIAVGGKCREGRAGGARVLWGSGRMAFGVRLAFLPAGACAGLGAKIVHARPPPPGARGRAGGGGPGMRGRAPPSAPRRGSGPRRGAAVAGVCGGRPPPERAGASFGLGCGVSQYEGRRAAPCRAPPPPGAGGRGSGAWGRAAGGRAGGRLPLICRSFLRAAGRAAPGPAALRGRRRLGPDKRRPAGPDSGGGRVHRGHAEQGQGRASGERRARAGAAALETRGPCAGRAGRCRAAGVERKNGRACACGAHGCLSYAWQGRGGPLLNSREQPRGARGSWVLPQRPDGARRAELSRAVRPSGGEGLRRSEEGRGRSRPEGAHRLTRAAPQVRAAQDRQARPWRGVGGERPSAWGLPPAQRRGGLVPAPAWGLCRRGVTGKPRPCGARGRRSGRGAR